MFPPEDDKMDEANLSYMQVGRNTKETAEFIEKFYKGLDEVREGATFDELLANANNPLRFRRYENDESYPLISIVDCF